MQDVTWNPEALVSRVSVCLIAAIVVGAVLRLGMMSRVAVEHFDEAIYASNVYFGPQTNYQYPGREFYAPPLLPMLIEWTGIITAMLGLPRPDWLPMLPALLLGIGLIPSVWWIVRQWFGPLAADAGAWLVAVSGIHACYSRSALTDVPLLFWMLWAVYWSWRALLSPAVKPALLAGLFTALAWWTKYNGWLPLAIAMSGGLAATLLQPRGERRWPHLARTLAIITATAGVLWLPVLWDCQDVGGYAAISANHRGYITGWASWWSNWCRQDANILWYEDGLTPWFLIVIGTILVLVRVTVAERSQTAKAAVFERSRLALVAMLLLLAVGGVSIWFPLTALALGGLMSVILAAANFRRPGEIRAEERLAGALVSAWLLGLILATPLYAPYPRLSLPLWLAAVLGTSWLIRRLSRLGENSGEVRPSPAEQLPPQATRLLCYSAIVGTLLVLASALYYGRPHVWEDRRSHDIAAGKMIAAIEHSGGDRGQAVILTYGSPALFHAFSDRGWTAIPRADLRLDSIPPGTAAFVATGLDVEAQAAFRQEWERASARCEELLNIEITPSSLVLLDSHSPADLLAKPEQQRGTVTLYRVR